jgi:hypothetical protein
VIIFTALIRPLRKTYGPSFAHGCGDDEKLSHALHRLAAVMHSFARRDRRTFLVRIPET